MKSDIILFDLDRTLFDTDKMSAYFDKKIISTLGNTSLKELKEVKNKYIKSLRFDREFLPEEYVEKICAEFNFKNSQLLLDVFFSRENNFIYNGSLYREATEILKYLKVKKYRLGIYSEGTKKFQNHKFNSLNISHFLDKDLIFIVDAKDNTEVLKKIPGQAIVIDDKERVCEYLNNNNIKTIWLNKKGAQDSKKFRTIHHLSELKKIL